MVVMEFRPSRLRLALALGVHVVTAFSFLFLHSQALQVGLLVLVLCSALHAGWRWKKHQPIVMELHEDGFTVFAPAGIEQQDRVLAPSCVVFANFVWLQWVRSAECKGGATMLLRDQFSADDWRKLQVWLRLRVAALNGKNSARRTKTDATG